MKSIMVLVCLFSGATVYSQAVGKEAGINLLLPPSGVKVFAGPMQAVSGNGHSIPQNLFTQQFGFFCRQELKMQQAHIPVMFRLGSVDECNRLEQKPRYR